tara:strand:- start:1011 stop:1262 length:252 start_codon:yes stop_codon:yes gene_type:complete
MSEDAPTVRVFMTADTTTEPSPYGKERPTLNDVQRIIIHTIDGRLVIRTDEEGHVSIWSQDILFERGDDGQAFVYRPKGDDEE